MLQPTHDNFFLLYNYAIMTLYILQRSSSRFTSRIRPSWPQSRVRLRFLLLSSISILLVCFGPPSILLFTPTHVSHSNPPSPAGQLNTNVQVCKQHGYATSYIFKVTYISTSHSYYYSLQSSYFFHSFGQAGWLRPFTSVTGLIDLYYKKIWQIFRHLEQKAFEFVRNFGSLPFTM
jgi:hypothetical protein